MDRRTFIKLTAVTGTSATLASCGNPENVFIRFVPDDDIVPGQAVFKPSVCPLCPAGCGLTVRVMDADTDVVRNGQAGVMRIAAAKKLEGSAMHPINHGTLCARGQGRGGYMGPSDREARIEARWFVGRRQPAGAGVRDAARVEPSTRVDRTVSIAVRRAAAGIVRAVQRPGIAARERSELRT
jgi:hypothetical protein